MLLPAATRSSGVLVRSVLDKVNAWPWSSQPGLLDRLEWWSTSGCERSDRRWFGRTEHEVEQEQFVRRSADVGEEWFRHDDRVPDEALFLDPLRRPAASSSERDTAAVFVPLDSLGIGEYGARLRLEASRR